jgi:acetyl/propionyl-CoA carboxylase alpha subunit
LRIASGEALRFTQADVTARGWAIEVRLNAEDPAYDYAPQAGTIATFDVPRSPGVRLDAGVRSGSEVPVYYDSLLAKIIVWDEDRTSAIARLDAALAQTRITGLATNLPLLRAIAADAAFASGDTTTSYLAERGSALAEHAAQQHAGAQLAAAASLLRSGYGWRLAGVGIPLVLEHAGARVNVTADRTADGWRLRGDLQAEIPFDGPIAALDAGIVVAAPPNAIATHRGATAGSGDVSAPMPGKIVSVEVQAGGSVKTHDLLVVLEAMKMEHHIEAPLTGTVTALHVAPGDIVAAGAALVTIGSA